MSRDAGATRSGLLGRRLRRQHEREAMTTDEVEGVPVSEENRTPVLSVTAPCLVCHREIRGVEPSQDYLCADHSGTGLPEKAS